jgi:uncharacterized protein YbjT (DUF2867 family)
MKVFVAGGTGRFGRIADLLLGRGHAVRAMTRNPNSPAAGRLRLLGAEVVAGDFDETRSLAAAAQGADAAFASGAASRAGSRRSRRESISFRPGSASCSAGSSHPAMP